MADISLLLAKLVASRSPVAAPTLRPALPGLPGAAPHPDRLFADSLSGLGHPLNAG